MQRDDGQRMQGMEAALAELRKERDGEAQRVQHLGDELSASRATAAQQAEQLRGVQAELDTQNSALQAAEARLVTLDSVLRVRYLWGRGEPVEAKACDHLMEVGCKMLAIAQSIQSILQSNDQYVRLTVHVLC